MAAIDFYKRRCGNTTRQVDEWVQQLFSGKVVTIMDHAAIREQNYLSANTYARQMFLRRMLNEHGFDLKQGSELQEIEPFKFKLVKYASELQPPVEEKPFEWTSELVHEFIMRENCGYSKELLGHQIKGFIKEKKAEADKPPRPVLFTTEDGKEIFARDAYWHIVSDNTPQMEVAVEAGREQYRNRSMKTFSTPEAAQSYADSKKQAERGWEIVKYGYAQNNQGWPDSRYIHSVRRLSDGEVFSIGDKVSWGIHPLFSTTLTGFIIKDGRLKMVDSACPDINADFLNALHLHKVNQPSPLKESAEQKADPEPESPFVWTDELALEFLNAHRSSDQIVAKWYWKIESVEAFKNWKQWSGLMKGTQALLDGSVKPDNQNHIALKPRIDHARERLEEVTKAIRAYIEADKHVPVNLIDERWYLEKLVEKLSPKQKQ